MSSFPADTLRVDFSGPGDGPRRAALDRAGELYRRHGCFIATGLLAPADLAPTQDYIRRLIQLRMAHAGIRPEPEPDGETRFDDGFLQLSRADRAHGGVIFDACRRLLPLHVLSVDPRLIGVAQALMNTNTVIASDVKAIRVDHPQEDKYLFDWHQDYPYIMDSEDAVVLWIPLQDVDDTNGCLRVAVGSHRLGLLKMRIRDLRNRENNKQKFMEIADKNLVNDFPHVTLPMRTCEVLVFSTLTLHASQANRGRRGRWTAQVRFGNYEHARAVARDWPGSLRDGHWFDQRHRDYVVEVGEQRSIS